MLKKSVAAVIVLVMLTGLQIPVFADNHGEPPVRELEQQFRDLIYNIETAQDYEVVQHDSIESLKEEFTSIMVPPLADYYLEIFYKEQDGNVYLIPTEGPIRLNLDEDYTLEKISDDQYKLTQHGENPLKGEYTLTITYSYEDGNWIFSDRMDQVSSSESGGELPDTATSLPTMMAIGVAVMVLGALLLIFRRNPIA